MKKRLGFYKNLILALASALTLIAVSFAWFTSPSENLVPSIVGTVNNPTYASVMYYVADDYDNYSRLDGNMELKDWVSGSFQKYKLIMTTTTDEPLKLGMSIDNLPSNMNADLKNSVQVKYTVYKAVKQTDKDGKISFADGEKLFGSEYMRLSECLNGVIFEGRSLEAHQAGINDVFLIYYEIGLAADSPSTIQGMSSSLGKLQINVQPVS